MDGQDRDLAQEAEDLADYKTVDRALPKRGGYRRVAPYWLREIATALRGEREKIALALEAEADDLMNRMIKECPSGWSPQSYYLTSYHDVETFRRAAELVREIPPRGELKC